MTINFQKELDQINSFKIQLMHFLKITEDQANFVANVKLDCHKFRIWEMEEKQKIHFTKNRAVSIKNLQINNPLRKIKDEQHALNIYTAFLKHKNKIRK